MSQGFPAGIYSFRNSKFGQLRSSYNTPDQHGYPNCTPLDDPRAVERSYQPFRDLGDSEFDRSSPRIRKLVSISTQWSWLPVPANVHGCVEVPHPQICDRMSQLGDYCCTNLWHFSSFQNQLVHRNFEKWRRKVFQSVDFRFRPTFMDALRSPIHRFAIVWASSEIIVAQICDIDLTVSIWVWIRLRFKSETDPSVRPGLLLQQISENRRKLWGNEFMTDRVMYVGRWRPNVWFSDFLKISKHF